MSDLGIFCPIVPPYLLTQLVRTGAMAPAVAEATLRMDTELRGRRLSPDSGTAQGETAGRWTVYDAEQGTSLPGVPLRSEGEPETGDVSADEAARGIAATLDLYRDVYGRDSFDGAGATAMLTVHYGQDYANAFWDGAHLVFGDGDGRVFGRFTAALDVLAHEFSHAVTERTTGLVYRGQSGALNESMSDVFGACVKQQVLGQDAAAADWLIGDGIFMEGINARALRDMANPGTAYDDAQFGTDPQPAHMDDYVNTTDDNGGVHINSGIPNRAFVLAALAVGGSTAEGAGRIWYSTLTSGQVRPDSDFVSFAAATVDQAGEHADAVRQAWEAVGIVLGSTPSAPGSPTPAPQGLPTDPAPTDPAPSEPAPTDPAPTDPAPSEPAPTEGMVAVRRSGGFLGRSVEGSIDLGSSDPRVPHVRALVARCDFGAVASGSPQADRFVYDFWVGAQAVQVPEQHLTPELTELADVVLDGDL